MNHISRIILSFFKATDLCVQFDIIDISMWNADLTLT